VSEAVALARALREGLEKEPTPHEVVVMPPFTALAEVGKALKGSPIVMGAQNMHWEREGAFTGEISPAMLRDVGCAYVILGHSERRHIFDETDERLSKKSRAAFDNGLIPMVCVGETLAERESNRTLEVVERQVERALRPLSRKRWRAWSSPTSPSGPSGPAAWPRPDQAEEVQAFLRKRIAISHGDDAAEAVRILYGGSVNPGNTPGIMIQADVDGVLVGGASLKAESFLGIVQYARKRIPEPPFIVTVARAVTSRRSARRTSGRIRAQICASPFSNAAVDRCVGDCFYLRKWTYPTGAGSSSGRSPSTRTRRKGWRPCAPWTRS
jgi:triosephosphate isomerase